MSSLPNYPEGKTYSLSPKGLEKIIEGEAQRKYPGQHIIWTDDIRVELPVRVGTEGMSAVEPSTLIRQWKDSLAKNAKLPALSVKRNKKWVTWTFEEYFEESMRVARSLVALGLPEFAGVNLIGFNAPEWVMGFNGSSFARCVPVGIYTTNSKDVCEYIVKHSETRVVIAENRELAKKYFDLLESGDLWRIVLYSDEVGSQDFGGRLMSWDSFLSLGKDVDSSRIEERMSRVTPGQCCSLVYTSGTTGMPKGVMLSHDNCTWTPKAQQSRQKYPDFTHKRIVSYLPLSHVAALYFDLLLSILKGMHVFFAEPTALQGTLVQTLQEVRPHAFFAVPRVWEKIYTKIKQEENHKGDLAKKMIDWAQSHGVDGSIKERKGEQTSWQFKLAKKLVFDKVKEALGLQQATYFGYGAAPLDPAVRRYLLSMNFALTNAYGMTETTAPHSGTPIPQYNPISHEDFLEVGFPMPGGSTIIKKERQGDDEGEICMRGRNIMMGYLKQPKVTSETIDSQGYVHSGDLGRINGQGFLYITGRAKELIITAGGENVPPILIENEIKKALPCLSNVMLVGDQKPYLTCILSLLEDPPMSGNLEKSAAAFLAGKQCAIKTAKQAENNSNFRRVIMEGLKEANQKAISRAQMVHNFHLMGEDFSVDNGTLTPSLKLKRREAHKKYAADIEQMYATAKL